VDAKALRAWVRGEALVKRGHGSLDDSLTWRLLLEGPPSPWGQRYVVDSAGHPRRRQWSLPRARDLVITDAPTTVEGAVCSVAAGHAALWVNPIV
jgi:hypothetical protein